MTRTAVACIAFIFCITAGPAVVGAEPALPQTGVMKGKVAPDFTLQDITGKTISLSSAKNSVICLQFWATWCPYCIREMPRFKQLHKKFSGKGLKILSINIAANDPLPRVVAYQKKAQLPYPVLYDSRQEVSRRFLVTGIPVSIVIDRKGVIQHRGYQLPDNIELLIAQLL